MKSLMYMYVTITIYVTSTNICHAKNMHNIIKAMNIFAGKISNGNKIQNRNNKEGLYDLH